MNKYCSFFLTLVAAASMPAAAQYAPSAGAPTRGGDTWVTPNKGQNRDQLWADRYACYNWAKSQSGFDPNVSAAPAPGLEAAYQRAFAACLEGRGYTVNYGPATAVPPVPLPAPVPRIPPAAPYGASYYSPPAPELNYHPFSFQVDGGYTVAAGATGRGLDDGANAGLGLTWFPSAALPVGLRIDGSYSWFDARSSLLDDSGSTRGRENIYGGDADLQFDLAHRSSRSKLYLFGGAGWYREQTRLHQISGEEGTFCGPFYCAPGYGPVVTGEERSTSPWRSSWNAGLGWETALPNNTSLFLEARYWRIAPMSSKTQFVPISIGLRF